MRHGASWYPRYPKDFVEGCIGLTAREMCVYCLALDKIYASGGQIEFDAKWIGAEIKDMGPASVRRTIEALIAKGKLDLTEDGKISNRRARELCRTREEVSKTNRKNGRKGGRKSAASRRAAEPDMFDIEDGEEEPAARPRQLAPAARSEPEVLPPGWGETLRDRVILAMGFRDPAAAMTAGGHMIGDRTDALVMERWKADLGLSENDIVETVRDACLRWDPNDPPRSFSAFTPAMKRCARARAEPMRISPARGGEHDARAPTINDPFIRGFCSD
ncbi:hypothetical protein DSD19_04660 [Rhodovulum sp. BSW8]|uniref:DUF1376 domain-containing protein n=1 Tax=Rhodovulum sp. BSW8 TaxID=2259645 RepID=UPI000DE27937|nr:DUF1376 domain-containing protein [Rhodovulum sp. BSW8]RBO54672.1 hypothetical protein DSD19_04660 [Rhodovulum sp. BSW8]